MCSVLSNNMATVNKTANESNESKLINDNESNDLNDHQHSETSEDQLIKNEMEGMEEEESEDELSVGSPDEQAEQEMSTTAALRILRKRKNSDRNESDNEDDDDDKPLDFTKKIEGGENNYFLPFKKLEMTTEQNDQKSKKRGVAGFSIDDILSHKTKELKEKEKQQNQINPNSPPSGQPIVRPWDIVAASGAAAVQAAVNAAAHSANGGAATPSFNHHRKSGSKKDDSSPLDALFQMASKTFEGLKAKSELDPSQLTFSSKQPPKKKRKSRTAFTNHQIFELEKRFLYQKYLSPADRDEIAAQLGLSNAQVITWFQNRRAKLKRDMEELRKDVECTSQIMPHALAQAAAAGHPHQVAAAAAVASQILASRNAAAAAVAVSKYNSLDLHRSPPPLSTSSSHPLHAVGLSAGGAGHQRERAESSTSLISPRSPPDSVSAPADSRSPPIRVTDSDG